MTNNFSNLYEFGDFRFEDETCTLWRGEEMLPIPPKASEVLRLLLKNNGKLVTKQEILNTVWAETFVEEGVLTQSIYTLRQTLGKTENGSQFIQTVPRRGYRFIVPVTAGESENKERGNLNFDNDNSNSPENSLISNEFLQTDSLEKLPKTLQKFAVKAETAEKPSLKTFRSNSLIFTVCVALIFAVVLIGIYKFSQTAPENPNSKIAPIEQLKFQRLTDSGDVVYPTISPSGELLAFVRLEADGASVWVKPVSSDNPVQILPLSSKGYRSLAFSPDGRNLFFRNENANSILQTSVFGGTPKKVAENVHSDFSFSPDGKKIVFIRRDLTRNAFLLISVNIDGTEETELSVKTSPEDFKGSPAWSPDGSEIAVIAGIKDQLLPKLLSINLKNKNETPIETPKWRAITRIIWTADGKNLIVSARDANEATSQVWLLSYPKSEVRRLTNDLESYFWLSISNDNKLVTRQQRIVTHLWHFPELDEKKALQITNGERNFDGFAGLAWTADRKIIYCARNGNITDLYKINPDGTERIQLTDKTGQENANPVVTADGKYIVFASNRSGNMQIWRIDADGRNPKQLTFGETATENSNYPSVSAQNSEVFFIRRGKNPPSIWKVSIEGENPTQVLTLNDAAPEGFLAISPDGKWLSYRHISASNQTESDNPSHKIGVIPTDRQSEPKLFDLDFRRPVTHWNTNSLSFDFASGAFNSSILFRQPVDGGNPQKILEFPDRVYNFAWSKDGKNLVAAKGKQLGDAILITNLP